MAPSAFRRAVETTDLDAMRAALAPGVTFASPAVFKPYEGRDVVMVVIGAVFDVLEDFRYVDEMREGAREMLRFRARVGDREIEGVDLVSLDETGAVAELTVMIRPLSALVAVRDAMGARLAAAG